MVRRPFWYVYYILTVCRRKTEKNLGNPWYYFISRYGLEMPPGVHPSDAIQFSILFSSPLY